MQDKQSIGLLHKIFLLGKQTQIWLVYQVSISSKTRSDIMPMEFIYNCEGSRLLQGLRHSWYIITSRKEPISSYDIMKLINNFVNISDRDMKISHKVVNGYILQKISKHHFDQNSHLLPFASHPSICQNYVSQYMS